ncbi:MAG: hypothetical protein ACE5E2_07345 [Candidatus Binatia bacterium]
MTPIEIIATIFAVIVIIKLVVITVNPNLWMKLAGAMLKSQVLTTLIYAVLAVIIGYYVFTDLTVVQVAAVMLLTSTLIGVGIRPYSKIILKLGEEMIGTGVSKAWLAMLIWGVLAVWVLYSVFTKTGF